MDELSLLSIKDFFVFLGVSKSTLRYYDEIGLLPAASRGENNYRFYTPFQIIKLNYINVLIDLGVTLSTIKDMDVGRTPESVIELLSRQEIRLDYRLYELRSAYSIIHTYRKNIQDGLMAKDGDVRLENLEEMRYILGQENHFAEGDSFYGEFVRFCTSADKNRINLRYPVGGYHADMASYLKDPGRPSRFFSLDPLGNSAQPGGKHIVTFTRGFYGEFGETPRRMAEFAESHSLRFAGPVFIVFLLDEISTTDPDKYLARVTVPVSPISEGRGR
jgi:DNA-binding transcriptional MerR regulator